MIFIPAENKTGKNKKCYFCGKDKAINTMNVCEDAEVNDVNIIKVNVCDKCFAENQLQENI